MSMTRTAVSAPERPPGPTLDDIRRWPAAVNVEEACAAFGLSRSYGYELVKRGEFPAKTLLAGGRVRVITASIVAVLGG